MAEFEENSYEQEREFLSDIRDIQREVADLQERIRTAKEYTKDIDHSINATEKERRAILKDNALYYKKIGDIVQLLNRDGKKIAKSLDLSNVAASLTRNNFIENLYAFRDTISDLPDELKDVGARLQTNSEELESRFVDTIKQIRSLTENPDNDNIIELGFQIRDIETQIENLVPNNIEQIRIAEEELDAIRSDIAQKLYFDRPLEEGETLESLEEQLELYERRLDFVRREREFEEEIYKLNKLSLEAEKDSLEIEQKMEAIAAAKESRAELMGFAEGKVGGIGAFNQAKGVLGDAAGFAKKHPIMLAAVGVGAALTAFARGVAKLFSMAAGRLNAIENSVINFRKEFGATAEQSQELFDYIDSSSEKFMAIGLSSDEIAQNITEMRSRMGFVRDITEEEIDFVNQLNARLGISATVGAGVVDIFSMMTDETGKLPSDLGESIIQMAELGKVAPGQIMQDISENSGDIFTYMRGTPIEIARAAVQARQLGINIGKVADISKQLLDFESSITSELEASVLLGQQINLTRARAAAFRGDMEGVAEEITRIISSVDLDRLNPVQMEALQTALSLSAEEMQKMSSLQDKMSTVTRADVRAFGELSDDFQDKLLRRETITAKDIQEYKTLQTSQDKLRDGWDSIKDSMSKQVMPIVQRVLERLGDVMLKFSQQMSDSGTWNKLVGTIDSIGDKVISIADTLFTDRGLEQVVNTLKTVADYSMRIVKAFVSVFEKVITFFGGPSAGMSGTASSLIGGVSGTASSLTGGVSSPRTIGTTSIGEHGPATTPRADAIGKLNPNLKSQFDELSERVVQAGGAPLDITSGFRTKEHNHRIGGVVNSKHLTGDAIDVGFPDDTSRQLAYAIANEMPGIRFNDYNNTGSPWHLIQVNDALIRPEEKQIVTFNPNDLIMAVDTTKTTTGGDTQINAQTTASTQEMLEVLKNVNTLLQDLRVNGVNTYMDGKKVSRQLALTNRG